MGERRGLSVNGRWFWWVAAACLLVAAAVSRDFRGLARPSALPVEDGAVEAAAAAAGSVGEGCTSLSGWMQVELRVRVKGATPVQVGTGYIEPTTRRVLAPARRVVTPFAPGPFGVHWEEESRVASFLREGDVLSIHFPEGKDRSSIAILNGEVVGADTFICNDRVYMDLGFLADSLGLRRSHRGESMVLLEAR